MGLTSENVAREFGISRQMQVLVTYFGVPEAAFDLLIDRTNTPWNPFDGRNSPNEAAGLTTR